MGAKRPFDPRRHRGDRAGNRCLRASVIFGKFDLPGVSTQIDDRDPNRMIQPEFLWISDRFPSLCSATLHAFDYVEELFGLETGGMIHAWRLYSGRIRLTTNSFKKRVATLLDMPIHLKLFSQDLNKPHGCSSLSTSAGG